MLAILGFHSASPYGSALQLACLRDAQAHGQDAQQSLIFDQRSGLQRQNMGVSRLSHRTLTLSFFILLPWVGEEWHWRPDESVHKTR